MLTFIKDHDHKRLLGALVAVGIWVAFIAGVILHFYVRSHADDLGRGPYSVDGIERAVFRGLPSLWIQHWLGVGNPVIKWADIVLYASWFYGPVLLGLLVQIRCGSRVLAGLFAMHLVLFFSADVMFALFPTRPPWMDINVTRVISEAYGTATSADANPVAAVPSLHVAVPALYTIFCWRQGDVWLRRIAPLLALRAAGIGWAVVYGGEHYVIDVMAGVAWATGVYVLCSLAWAAVRRRTSLARTPLEGAQGELTPVLQR